MSNTRTIIHFTFLSIASFILIYMIPPSTNILFPAFQHVRDTGTYPDGLKIRRSYTGIIALDEMFIGLAGFFSAAVDGHDEATRMFCLWFLPQLCSILVFLYWEAGRVNQTSIIAFPTFFGVLAQLITAGVVLPLYFAIHILVVPLFPTGRRGNPRLQARSLLPAIMAGFLLPSAILFLFPTSTRVPIDTKQILAALWQPFPVYIAIIYHLISHLVSSSPVRVGFTSFTKFDIGGAETEVVQHVRWAYLFSAIISAIPHWTILVPSIFVSDSLYSFAQIFIPYPLHSLMGVQTADVTPYRLSIRLLFQNDCLTTTIAALAFFSWTHGRMMHSMGTKDTKQSWTLKMMLFTLVGGPGASIAWAASERERLILDAAERSESGGSNYPNGVLKALNEKSEEK